MGLWLIEAGAFRSAYYPIECYIMENVKYTGSVHPVERQQMAEKFLRDGRIHLKL
jgi:hypothetical protein